MFATVHAHPILEEVIMIVSMVWSDHWFAVETSMVVPHIAASAKYI